MAAAAGIIIGALFIIYPTVRKEQSLATKAGASPRRPTSVRDFIPTTSQPEGKAPLLPPNVESEERACDPGPHDVGPGNPTRIALDVRQGDHLHGYLEEVDGERFTWLIMSAEDLAKYLDRRRHSYLARGVDVPAGSVDGDIPSGGRWYLILDGYAKQNIREVRTDPWRRRFG